MIRTLIVDDEPLAREGIRVRLQLERDIEIVGEAGNGKAAVAAIQQLLPDLIFLDVQMPGMDGFEVVESVSADIVPAIVFVTAYDTFALRAFEVHALDYLLKPVTADRFQRALTHVRNAFESGNTAHSREKIARALDSRDAADSADTADGAKYMRRIVVKHDGKFIMLRSEEIDWIESAANYVNLFARGSRFTLRSTMSQLSERLDPSQFARIHRSTMINLDRVSEIRPEWHGDFDVILSNGKSLRMSRSYRGTLLPR